MKSETHPLQRAMLAGLLATVVLTALMYAAPAVGLPNVDMAASIGSSLTTHAVRPGTPGWILGMAVFLFIGSVLSPLLFFYAFPGLFGGSWLRGIEWGVLVWAFGGAIAMIFMGVGFNEPHISHPHLTSLCSFLGHLVYGIVLAELAVHVFRARRRPST